MERSEGSDERLPLSNILRNLDSIRDKLVEIRERNGSPPAYHAMKKEIEALGWGGILQRYHPDINVDDPAPFALFALYRFVYATMRRR